VPLTNRGMACRFESLAPTCVFAGIDLKTVQTRLGHSDPRLTLSIYAQAVVEADTTAAEILGAHFLPIPPPV
jgi:integrase